MGNIFSVPDQLKAKFPNIKLISVRVERDILAMQDVVCVSATTEWCSFKVIKNAYEVEKYTLPNGHHIINAAINALEEARDAGWC
jgi:hypothetical protein